MAHYATSLPSYGRATQLHLARGHNIENKDGDRPYVQVPAAKHISRCQTTKLVYSNQPLFIDKYEIINC